MAGAHVQQAGRIAAAGITAGCPQAGDRRCRARCRCRCGRNRVACGETKGRTFRVRVTVFIAAPGKEKCKDLGAALPTRRCRGLHRSHGPQGPRTAFANPRGDQPMYGLSPRVSRGDGIGARLVSRSSCQRRLSSREAPHLVHRHAVRDVPIRRSNTAPKTTAKRRASQRWPYSASVMSNLAAQELEPGR